MALLARSSATPPRRPASSSDVAPILQKNCLACHSSAAKMGGLVMEKFDLLMKGGAHGPAIVPGKSGESRMVMMLEGKIQPRMPFGGDPLPAADIATIKAWIDAGGVGPVSRRRRATLAPAGDTGHQARSSGGLAHRVAEVLSRWKTSCGGRLSRSPAHRPCNQQAARHASGHADYVRSIAFSPDGKMLAAAAARRSAEAKSKSGISSRTSFFKTMQGDKDCIYSVAWSPDGKIDCFGQLRQDGEALGRGIGKRSSESSGSYRRRVCRGLQSRWQASGFGLSG